MSGEPSDVPRLRRALDLCGVMWGLWFTASIATLLLLRSGWHLGLWLVVTLVGTIVLRFIGDTIAGELARQTDVGVSDG